MILFILWMLVKLWHGMRLHLEIIWVIQFIIYGILINKFWGDVCPLGSDIVLVLQWSSRAKLLLISLHLSSSFPCYWVDLLCFLYFVCFLVIKSQITFRDKKNEILILNSLWSTIYCWSIILNTFYLYILVFGNW